MPNSGGLEVEMKHQGRSVASIRWQSWHPGCWDFLSSHRILVPKLQIAWLLCEPLNPCSSNRKPATFQSFILWKKKRHFWRPDQSSATRSNSSSSCWTYCGGQRCTVGFPDINHSLNFVVGFVPVKSWHVPAFWAPSWQQGDVDTVTYRLIIHILTDLRYQITVYQLLSCEATFGVNDSTLEACVTCWNQIVPATFHPCPSCVLIAPKNEVPCRLVFSIRLPGRIQSKKKW